MAATLLLEKDDKLYKQERDFLFIVKVPETKREIMIAFLKGMSLKFSNFTE